MVLIGRPSIVGMLMVNLSGYTTHNGQSVLPVLMLLGDELGDEPPDEPPGELELSDETSQQGQAGLLGIAWFSVRENALVFLFGESCHWPV